MPLFSLPWLTIMILAAVNFVVLPLLFVRKRGSTFIAVTLILFNAGIAIWQISLIYFNFIEDVFLAHKMAFWGANFAGLGLLGLAFVFPDKQLKSKLSSVFFGVSIISGLIAVSILATDLVIEGYVSETGEVVFGPLGSLMLVLLGGILVFSLGVFVYRYFSEIRERYYFRFVFVSFMLYVPLALLINLILPLLGVTEFTFGGALLASLPQAAIVYTVLANKIHAIEYLVTQIISVFIVAIFIWVGFVVLLLATGVGGIDVINDANVLGRAMVYSIFLGVAVVLVQQTSSRFGLYRFALNLSASQEVFRTFSVKISTILEIDKLSHEFVDALKRTTQPEFIVSYIHSNRSAAEFFDKNVDVGITAEDMDNLWRSIMTLELSHSYTISELEKELHHKNNGHEVLEGLHKAGVQVLIVTGVDGSPNGVFLLGYKLDQTPYTIQDLSLLNSLGSSVSIAFARALLHAEVLQFNERLKGEVDHATQDLAERNQRLSVLRRLDRIVLNTLSVNDLAQQVVDLVSWEMGFNGALMVLKHNEKDQDVLQAVAASSTPVFKKALKMLPIALDRYKMPFNIDPSNLFYRSISEKKPFETRDFAELYTPPLNKQLAHALQKVTRTKCTVVYPILARGEALGAIAFDTGRSQQDLTAEETEMIAAFMDEVGIAIENIRLYTELQHRNEQLSHANYKLKELDQMKDELVSVASHELRTPMTVIKSYLWMALNKYPDSLNEKMTGYLERAFESSERMINLVNDMLSASRLEGKRVELHLEEKDIVELVADVVKELDTKAKEKNLKLKFKQPKKKLPLVSIDFERMFEILVNVIGNAIKYTEKGSVVVTISEHTTQSSENDAPEGRFAWVTVKDTGKGIAEEDIPRLFKKFSKLEQGSFSKMAEAGGTGLGLYITKGFVDLHGGKIWVESKIDKGSSFIFSIPMVEN